MTQFASTLYPQTNPTNPVLLKLRDIPERDRQRWIVGFFLAEPFRYNWPNWSQAHVSHASRVLTRLGSISG